VPVFIDVSLPKRKPLVYTPLEDDSWKKSKRKGDITRTLARISDEISIHLNSKPPYLLKIRGFFF